MADRRESDITRRDFVQQSGLLAAGAVIGGQPAAGAAAQDSTSQAEMPTTVLGRTGFPITRMMLGTVPCGMPDDATPQKVAKVIDAALEAGIRAIDTAPVYVNAEAGAGLALGSRRKEVVLTTKVWCDTVEEAEKSLANSLKLLKTDYLDILYLHSVGSRGKDRDPNVALRPDGVFPWLLKQKKLGKCRAVGVSSHNAPLMCKQMLETGDVDVLMTVINFIDRRTYNHEQLLIPVAKKHGTGVIAMKVFGGARRLEIPKSEFNTAGPAEMDKRFFKLAIRYAMGVPGVSVVNLGCGTPEQLRENVAVVKDYKPLSPEERTALDKVAQQLAPKWSERFGPAKRVEEKA